jgi:serine phosphatase RsbU (regulator of sigma subunit)
MKLRIRTKCIGVLVIAAVLPLTIALVAVQVLGVRYYRHAQGTLLEVRAHELARSLGLAAGAQVSRVHDWIALSDLRDIVLAAEVARAPQSDAEFAGFIEGLEGRWAALRPEDEPLRGLMQNEVASELHAFRMINPLFAEVLATGTRGELIGSSDKTSDYWQGDEVWWQRAMRQKFRCAYVEGINYDTSAGVYSVDVSVPIRSWSHAADPPVGVVKTVVNASPLLSSFAPTLAGDSAIHQVVLADGRILAQLSGPKITPLSESIAPEALERLSRTRPGWMVMPMRSDGEKQFVGFAPLNFTASGADEMGVTGLTPMYVVVYRPADEAFAPVRRQLWTLSGGGALLILGCVFAAYWIAGKKILGPLEALRVATRAVGASAKLGDQSPSPRALPALEPLRKIRTHDEFQELAHEFAYMAGRILTYHERLERDLAEKTAEIDRDLQMAREFQEALMPHSYPLVPSATTLAAVALAFHHIYRPASSVGGDFFDVLKLSDHRAGIFIADVMGHGARSALVTAILRALLHNLADGTDDPAQFLTRLNQHFHEIVRDSHETIFVSAFYLIVDTETATASYASAGHPSPFMAHRATRKTEPLIDVLRGDLALGLLPVASYSKWTRAVRPGDIFVLFTDGVHEAYNASGEEFGLDRVSQTIAANLPGGGDELSQALIDAVDAFIQPATPADDICLVTVEITASPQKVVSGVTRIADRR